MRLLVGADVHPKPDSGAAGTVMATNAAFRELGHQVDEFWCDSMRHRIRHWNLHYLLELPREYRRVVGERQRQAAYDVVQLSQPHAWLAAKTHRRSRRPGIFVNRSHGLESMADAVLLEWHDRLGIPSNRFPRSLLSPVVRSRLHSHIDRVVEFSDGMLVPCADIRDHLVRHHGADADRIGIGYHGVPSEYLHRARKAPSQERARSILYVGQFAFIKGPALLARAMTAVLETRSDARLTWVCAAADHPGVKALFPPGLLPRVRLVDWMPREALIDLYDDHAVHVAHSLYESGAKSCVEGMARGQAVVSSAVGAMKEHIRDGENGFLVDVGDTDAMVRSALRVLADPDFAIRMGERARLSVQGLDWRACATSALMLYQRLAALRPVLA